MLELIMRCLRRRSWCLCVLAMWLLVLVTMSHFALAQDKPASTSTAQVAKAVGTIKTIQADSITVAAESGGEVTAKLTGSTKILRVPPGEKDLKNATALQVQDLQPGDRVLVRGQASGDGHVISALAVIVMKQADVAAKQQHERDDWQKRGVGGLVTKVDAATGTISISSSISSSGVGASRTIAVHVAKDTILRRYAPGSVKFDDAKPAPIDQIKAGDQLRARGTRTPDGNEIAAEEIVTGSFRNIAGNIKAIDAAGNTITVQDVISKSAVMVKVSSDSQMKKLPAEMAQRIAMRLKGAAAGTMGIKVVRAARGLGRQSEVAVSPQAKDARAEERKLAAGPVAAGRVAARAETVLPICSAC